VYMAFSAQCPGQAVYTSSLYHCVLLSQAANVFTPLHVPSRACPFCLALQLSANHHLHLRRHSQQPPRVPGTQASDSRHAAAGGLGTRPTAVVLPCTAPGQWLYAVGLRVSV
jgi:hypothetical protein